MTADLFVIGQGQRYFTEKHTVPLVAPFLKILHCNIYNCRTHAVFNQQGNVEIKGTYDLVCCLAIANEARGQDYQLFTQELNFTQVVPITYYANAFAQNNLRYIKVNKEIKIEFTKEPQCYQLHIINAEPSEIPSLELIVDGEVNVKIFAAVVNKFTPEVDAKMVFFKDEFKKLEAFRGYCQSQPHSYTTTMHSSKGRILSIHQGNYPLKQT